MTCRISVPVSVVSLFAALPGCGKPKPCADIEEGDRLQIEIVGPRGTPHAGEESCFRDWGLVEGSAIQGTVVELQSESACRSGVLDAPGVGDWEWTLLDDSSKGERTLDSLHAVTNGACEAQLTIGLTGPDSVVCTPNAGESCKLFVLFLPMGTEELCPPGCSTNLDVRLRRL
jgi:hypothetical protein